MNDIEKEINKLVILYFTEPRKSLKEIFEQYISKEDTQKVLECFRKSIN